MYQISSNGIVQRLTGDGVAASLGGKSFNAEMNLPNGIVADEDAGVLYMSEFSGARNLRKIVLKK
ncbi:MAG: hypothetical protein ACI9Y1_002273 [Lentisphaeria bacterium]